MGACETLLFCCDMRVLMKPQSKHHLATCSKRTGLSLVELMISVALVSTIAVAAGLAMHHAHRRSERTRAQISQQRNVDNVIKRFTEELRFASEIHVLTQDHITFSLPSDPSQNISYWCNDSHDKLFRTVAGEQLQCILQDVQLMFFAEMAGSRLTGVTVMFQTGSVDDPVASRFVPLINAPDLNTGGS